MLGGIGKWLQTDALQRTAGDLSDVLHGFFCCFIIKILQVRNEENEFISVCRWTLCVCVCVCVVSVTCSATSASSGSSETKLVVQSLDIQHDPTTSFAFIDQIIFERSVSCRDFLPRFAVKYFSCLTCLLYLNVIKRQWPWRVTPNLDFNVTVLLNAK